MSSCWVERMRRRTRGSMLALGAAVIWLLVVPAIGQAATCFGKEATIVGTNGIDRIRGTQGADVIVAKRGADTVKGRGGNDRICGGGTFDSIFGKRGRDRLSGGSGPDDMRPGSGKDVVKGGAGKDIVDYRDAARAVTIRLDLGTASGAGNDRLSAIESAAGSKYDDQITGTNGPNFLAGARGSDDVYGLGGDDNMFGDLAFGGPPFPGNDFGDGGSHGATGDECSGFETELNCYP